MGLLSWLKGGPKWPDDKRTRWLRERIERAMREDADDRYVTVGE